MSVLTSAFSISVLKCPLHQSAPSRLLKDVAPAILSFVLCNGFPLSHCTSWKHLVAPPFPAALDHTLLPWSVLGPHLTQQRPPCAPAPHSSSLDFLHWVPRHQPHLGSSYLSGCFSSARYLISKPAYRCPAPGGHLGSPLVHLWLTSPSVISTSLVALESHLHLVSS